MNSFPSGSSLEIVRGRHFHGGAVFDPNQGTRETRARVSFLLAALLSLRFLSPPAAAESATARVRAGAAYCNVVVFPQWLGPAGDRNWKFDFYEGSGKFKFRKGGGQETEVLVSGSLDDHNGMRESLTFCALSLDRGICRPSSREEWDRAVPVPLERQYAQPPLVIAGDALTGDGKAYPKSGPNWLDGPSGTQRAPASPDGRYLAVYSYSGNFAVPEPLRGPILPLRHPVRGNYWVDIYDRTNARLTISIEGSFRGLSPAAMIEDAFWLNRHYYVIPLSPYGKKRAMVCNVAAAGSANQPPANKR